ncbi:hypothetical protein Tco_1359126, partial [Tanacetum coccineum]
MHNNIMAAGSKDRPPMLGPGRYSQWHSRFLRYLDTKSNGEYLRKCIFDGPYMPTNVLIAAVEAAENILPVAAHEEVETIHNMTAENKLYFQAEKEAIFLILTGIGDEIYSTVDACNTAKEMWTAIERLQQGESLNVQDVKTNLFWEFGKFTSRDGESMESYYSRFYKLMNELTRNNLQVSPMQVNVQFLQQLQPEWSRFVTVVKQRQEIDTVSYHKLFDVLKQFQNEVNDIRSERLARSANPLALLAAAQPYSDNYYQAPKPQRSTRRLAWRHASPYSLDHHPYSSSSSLNSSPVHSSGLDAPYQAHSGSSTRDVSPRLGYLPRRAPRRSEAFHHWCAAPLSILYLPTTSESSLGDSSERPLHSSSHSARPSRKRCRSPVDYVPSSTPVIGSLAPTRVDLLPPRKRFRDSYSSEASMEEDIEINPIETEVDMELGIGDGDDVRDHVEIDPMDVRDDTGEYEADTSAGDMVEVGIDPMSAPIVEEEIVEPAGEDSSDSSGIRDGIVRTFKDMLIDLDDDVRDFYHHMPEVRIDRIVGIETVQRRLEADQLIARGERVGMIERIESLRLENFKIRAMLYIERDHVNSLRLHVSLSHEEFRQVRRDRDDTRGRLRRLESYV